VEGYLLVRTGRRLLERDLNFEGQVPAALSLALPLPRPAAEQVAEPEAEAEEIAEDVLEVLEDRRVESLEPLAPEAFGPELVVG
jgi:hypothetical protein